MRLGRRALLGGLAGLPLAHGALAAGAMSKTVGEAEARKQRSTEKLIAEGVPYLESLPVIETVAEARPPSADAVARRFCALMVVTDRALGADYKENDKLRAALGGRAVFAKSELTFLGDTSPSREEIANASWVCERAVPLAWALGGLTSLSRPEKEVDVDRLYDLIFKDDGRGLVANATLRPTAEILDAADLNYRCDWACVEARVQNRDAPARLNGEIVGEWHWGFNWLIGQDSDWDKISTDT